MAIGISLYYSVGKIDDVIIEWIISPIIFILGEVSGPIYIVLYVVMDTLIWFALIYFGIISFKKVSARLRRGLVHSKGSTG